MDMTKVNLKAWLIIAENIKVQNKDPRQLFLDKKKIAQSGD